MTKNIFNGQWAVILGGSSGLGLASARKLASEGMNICIVHRDRRSDLESFDAEVKKMEAEGVSVKTYNLDALKDETIETVLSEMPDNGVRVLLHSIAKGSLKSMLGDEDNLVKEDFNISIHAMALSLYDWARAILKKGLFSDKARILAFTSEGNSRVWPNYAAISAAKVTLEALVRNMAVEFASHGITSNCVQAGITKTPSFNIIPGNEQITSFTQKRNPFKRLTEPGDVANVVYLLCREEADWINGTIIKADGGESLR